MVLGSQRSVGMRKSEEMMGDEDPVNVSFCPERVRNGLVKRGRAGDALERSTLDQTSHPFFDHLITT